MEREGETVDKGTEGLINYRLSRKALKVQGEIIANAIVYSLVCADEGSFYHTI